MKKCFNLAIMKRSQAELEKKEMAVFRGGLASCYMCVDMCSHELDYDLVYQSLKNDDYRLNNIPEIPCTCKSIFNSIGLFL